MDELQVTARREGDLGLLSIGGEMRMELATRLLERGQELQTEGAKHLLVNLRSVLFMDSASLAALIRLDQLLSAADGRVVLFGLSPAVKRVLENSGLAERFATAEDEDAARALVA